MPIQLRVHAAWPLNDRVPANRIIEGSDQDIRARGPGGADRFVHIRDQIAGALQSEWIRNRRLEPEYRDGAGRSHDQLRHGAAGCRSYGENALLGCFATECGNQAGDKTVKVLWSNVDMRRVVLLSDSYANRAARLLALRECAEVSRFAREPNRQKDRHRRSGKDLFQSHSVSPKPPIKLIVMKLVPASSQLLKMITCGVRRSYRLRR